LNIVPRSQRRGSGPAEFKRSSSVADPAAAAGGGLSVGLKTAAVAFVAVDGTAVELVNHLVHARQFSRSSSR
jgi:uncharacterized spore protein YtfJ